jgi:hypothetical protein
MSQITPTPLKLIVITCKTDLGCYINLELIAKNMQLTDQLVGKKLLNVTEEGDIKKKKKKPVPEPIRGLPGLIFRINAP